MTSIEHELREFVCKSCGHKVVVNPNLPADYTPNICTPCFERTSAEARAEIFSGLMEFVELLEGRRKEMGPALRRLNRTYGHGERYPNIEKRK